MPVWEYRSRNVTIILVSCLSLTVLLLLLALILQKNIGLKSRMEQEARLKRDEVLINRIISSAALQQSKGIQMCQGAEIENPEDY